MEILINNKCTYLFKKTSFLSYPKRKLSSKQSTAFGHILQNKMFETIVLSNTVEFVFNIVRLSYKCERKFTFQSWWIII